MLPISYIEIDLNAIAQNLHAIRRHVGRAQVMAVVKANAYGHGALEVADTLLRAGADWLAVARPGEGVALRQGGITAPILVMNYLAPGEVESVLDYQLTPTLSEIDTARMLHHLAAARGQYADFHLKVDTGMGRFGLLPEELLPFVAATAQLPRLRFTGVFTHFATADEPASPYTRQQFAIFQDLLRALHVAGYPHLLRHAANSGAICYHPATHLDMVRAGVILYGMRPNPAHLLPFRLRPALSLKSQLIRLKLLPAGSSLGYGRSYSTATTQRIGLIPVGYGDGYPRLLSNRGAVLVGGRRVPIVGRVSMDQTIVDLSALPFADLHDEVVLIGQQGEGEISAENVAAWAETINYEVTTALLPRLPRRYQPFQP